MLETHTAAWKYQTSYLDQDPYKSHPKAVLPINTYQQHLSLNSTVSLHKKQVNPAAEISIE